MCEVIPGILEKDWSDIEKKLKIAKSFAKSVHIDIIDGKFAPNATFLDPTPFSKYSEELFLEVHIMAENPTQYLEPFAKSGFKRFIGQVESLHQPADQVEFITKAKLFGEVGLAIDGPTSLDLIKVPYQDLDCVLVMTVKAGQSGQVFNSECLKKIEMLKLIQDDTGVKMVIEVDGGINDKTILLVKNKGANRFASTSFIFGADPSVNSGPQKQYNLLKTIAER